MESWEYWYTKKEGTVEAELLTLERILKEKKLSRVLDFGCGARRHALHLVRNGFKVDGFDGSASQLSERLKCFGTEGYGRT